MLPIQKNYPSNQITENFMKIIEKNAIVKITKGVNKLAEIVAPTLGANGNNVIIEDQLGKIQIINDGASIINSIYLTDELENVGATLAKQVASRTNDEAGDGTTTSIVILNALLNEIKNHHSELRITRDKLKKYLAIAIKSIKTMARDIKDDNLEQIAFISSLDKDMSKTIASVYKTIGKEGVIEIVESKKEGIKAELVEGIQIDKGYASRLFTDNSSNKVEVENARVLISRKKIEVVSDIVPIMQALSAKSQNKLVIFCEDMSDEVLTLLILNKAQGQFNSLVVLTNDLDDVATVTGAKIIDDKANTAFNIDCLGEADRISASRFVTKILTNKFQKNILAKIKELNNALESSDNEYEKEKIRRRIARLQGGIAILKVGGSNELETGEKKLKLEDAVNAVNAAQEEGVVEGGGVALMRVAIELGKLPKTELLDIFIRVIESPYKQILKNATIDFKKINKNKLTYNTNSKKYEDFFEQGIIDPAKVTLSAVQNAFNAGLQVLTANFAVINKNKNDN